LGKALVLHRWILNQFGVDGLEALADDDVKRSIYEGWDENNESLYLPLIQFKAVPHGHLTKEQLLTYDRNITTHTLAITGKRGEVVRWKYFQYLALLFTEHYLDRYYGDTATLLKSLNGAQREQRAGALVRGQRVEQDRFLDGHRQRQNSADAREHPAAQALDQAARPQAGEPCDLGDAERRAYQPAFAGIHAQRHRCDPL
jgi:hypothetical protein